MRAEVALLSRNIKFTSIDADSDETYNGHIRVRIVNLRVVCCTINMKNKSYHTVGTFLKSNGNFVQK